MKKLIVGLLLLTPLCFAEGSQLVDLQKKLESQRELIANLQSESDHLTEVLNKLWQDYSDYCVSIERANDGVVRCIEHPIEVLQRIGLERDFRAKSLRYGKARGEIEPRIDRNLAQIAKAQKEVERITASISQYRNEQSVKTKRLAALNVQMDSLFLLDEIVKLNDQAHAAETSLNEIEKQLDRQMVGLYLKNKLVQMLNSSEICQFRKSCQDGEDNPISYEEAQQALTSSEPAPVAKSIRPRKKRGKRN